jgi:hypothetical protein
MTQSVARRRAGLAFGLALALAVVAAPHAGLARPDPAAKVTVTAADRAEFRAGMKSAGETIGLLIETYPDEYATFETKIITGIKSGAMDMPTLRAMTAEWATNLRARLASRLSQASDADLVGIGRTQLDVMRKLGPAHPVACAQFIENGGLTLDVSSGLDAQARAEVDRLGVQQLRAAKAALATPVERTPVSGGEVGPVIASFRKKGGDIAWLAAAGTPDKLAAFPGPARCDNALHWIETVLEQPAPLAARLLAK